MKRKKVMAALLMGAALMGMTAGGCGSRIDENAVFATLDGTTITMGVANFRAKYEQVMYDSIYMSYFGEDMWNNDMYGNGTTMTEDVKSQIAEELQEMYLLKAHMEEYGISLSEEDEAAMAEAAETFLSENSKEAIRQIGAENKENVIEMLRLHTIQEKMHERIIQDADANVTEEEAAQRTFSYVSINTDTHTDEESNQIEYTEEEKAELKTTAEGLSSAKDFEKAAEEAGYTVSTASYGSKDDEDASFDTAVLEAADKLKEGEMSDVIELENAYYVLRLDKEYDEEATASKKEQMITQKQEDYYADILDGWKEACKWEINEEEWAKVTFEDHFKLPEAEETETPDEGITDTPATEESAAGTEELQEAATEE